MNIENTETLKYYTFLKKKKALVLSIVCSKCGNKDKKIFKEEELNEISKILDSVINIEYQNKYDW